MITSSNAPLVALAVNSAAGGATVVDASNPIPTSAVTIGYILATAQGLAATTGGPSVVNVIGRVYVWDAQFTGTSLALQALGSDGVTWRTIATLNASGTFAGEIRIGANATIRVFNPNGAALTAVSSSIS